MYLSNNHYDVIKSPSAFFRTKSYCFYCLSPINNYKFHSCEYICQTCKRPNCTGTNYKKCERCFKQGFNDECLKIHSSLCTHDKYCSLCKTYYFNTHVCHLNHRYCYNCKLSVDFNHKCFIKIDEFVECKVSGYIFFDYECMQETGIHVPNLVIAHKYTNDGQMEEKKYFYKNGECVNNEFCKWLFTQDSYIAIAHNFKGYDSIFVINYILKNLGSCSPPSIINQGGKILGLSWKGVKMIDSYCFLPMALSDFSSSFGLEEIKKGYFPHFFNTKENQHYIGIYPEPKYYGNEYMVISKKEEFEKWYATVKNNTFDFKNELFSYCENDVDLLARGCLSFRQIILDLTGIEPFFKCHTIASLCHVIYRTKFMIPETIAIIPEIGYNPYYNSSIKSHIWLAYYSKVHNVYINHSKNGREFKVGKYLLDGVIADDKGNILKALEFHGCLFHGSIKKEKMVFTYGRHLERIKYIKANVPELIEIWECEYDAMMKDVDMKTFANSLEFRERIDPRDALFGGRTNASKLYYKIKPNERILHYDFTSLYPSVQKYCRFPIGHPKIITENFEDIERYFGLIKCRILPPKKLFFPVLPCRSHNKLVFALCSKCAELQFNKSCSHTDKERMLEGTWCTVEVNEAVKNGYVVDKIFEVWHYEQSDCYNEQTKQGGLFTSYINSFLKLKQEASGFPKWVKSESDKLQYKRMYYEKEGIELDMDKIKKNPGIRKVSKLMLNSHWGRFGMNSNKSKIKIIKDVNEWYDLVLNDQFNIHSINLNNPEIIQVSISENSSFHYGSNQTNVPLAAFVTAYARLKLFKYLNILNDRVLYYDTDSIVFVSDEHLENSSDMPQLGDYLGEFTDELDGNYIVEFVSAGPKNYAKLLNNGECQSVVKGFQLNYIAEKVVNFDSIKKIVLEDRSPLYVDQQKLTRSIKDWEINTSIIDKEYNLIYDKRILFDDLSTLPFGSVF